MTKLYKYQEEGVKQLIKFKGRALLADEMGLGKTLQVLTYLRAKPEALPAIVVCPATAKWVWKSEIRKHTTFKSGIIWGETPRRIVNMPNIIIINYEILTYWKLLLRKLDYGSLILDEAHYCKNYKALRTKAATSLGKKTKRVIAMSGTPITNRPKDMYPILHLILPGVFKSFVPYAFRYCGRKMLPWGWDDTGATHLDELHKKLKDNCMIRRTKKQVLKELPDKNRMVIPIPIEKRRMYDRIEKDFIGWLDNKDADKAVKARKAESLVKLAYLLRAAAELKMKYCFDWIDSILEETDEKLVVFARHKKIITMLKDKYKNSVFVDGSVTGIKRKKCVDKFQNDKKTRIFIGQIVAAGTAITLTAASTVVFAELDMVPANHIQAEDRVHRIGQTEKTFIYYLVAKGTIEEKLCKMLEKKFGIIQAVLDGETDIKDFDIYRKLLKCYERF